MTANIVVHFSLAISINFSKNKKNRKVKSSAQFNENGWVVFEKYKREDSEGQFV
jgi:hypothetical protein